MKQNRCQNHSTDELLNKGKIYKTIMTPVYKYGSESWARKILIERRMHVADIQILKWMCGVTRVENIRNEFLREVKKWRQCQKN